MLSIFSWSTENCIWYFNTHAPFNILNAGLNIDQLYNNIELYIILLEEI